jgi:hypothetical protein
MRHRGKPFVVLLDVVERGVELCHGKVPPVGTRGPIEAVRLR